MNPTGEQATTVGAGVVNLVLAAMDPVAQAIFGVPSQALLAAGAGVFFGRTFLPATGFRQTLTAWVGWTVASCYSVPLLMHFWGFPKGIVSSVAFALGLALQLFAPILVPELIKRSPAWVRAWIDRRAGVTNQGDQQ